MPKVRPFAAIAVAASLAACAAGGHNVPDEAAQGGFRHDSLVAGSAIPSTMPFAGTIYPVPPSHHRVAGSPAPGAVMSPVVGAEADTTGTEATADVPSPAPAVAPSVPPATTAAPAAPRVVQPAPLSEQPVDDDEHAGHTP
jgi:hypothetical protein